MIEQRPRAGFVLWLSAMGVFAASVVAGLVAAAFTYPTNLSALDVLPTWGLFLSVPLNALALIMSIVGITRPGVRRGHEYAALIGSIDTTLIAVAVSTVALIVGRHS